MTTLAPSISPPRPLQVGEHVLCTLSPSSSDPPVHAIVVALDKVYEQAAARFRATQSPLSSIPPRHLHLDLPHVIDSPDNSDDEIQSVPNPHCPTVDSDDELHPFPVDPSPTKILFREADSRPRNFQPSPPKSKNEKRRQGMASNAEALVTSKKTVSADDSPAPHPITSGRVYVHFSNCDRRLDRWANASELHRASASHTAAAASGVVANRLLDHDTADFAAASASTAPAPKLTRARRRAYEQVNPTSEKEIGNEAVNRMEKAREEKTKIRNVSTIVFGNYSIDAWYFSPFPLKRHVEFLYMCGKCLMYVKTSRKFIQHCTKCEWIDVPGKLLYDDTNRNLRVFEVSGVVNPDYCQRLCLLGKLFLDHKTLFFDVTPFLFYIVTLGGELAGFFSKEHPLVGSEYNVACIVTLPPHQKKGIGRFLISLSYELSKREGKTGSPERPLSDLGQLSYRSYWAYAITQYLRSTREDLSKFDKVPAATISEATGISCPDVVETLKSLQIVYMWRGETNADLSSKALESAIQKVSHPRLPFYSRNLKQTRSLLKMEANGASSAVAPRLFGTPTTRRQLRPKIHSERKQTSMKAHETKQRSPFLGRNSKMVKRRRIMESFVRKHGKDQILARLNTSGSLTTSEIMKLAQEVRLTPTQCRKKLLRYVREEVMANNAQDSDTSPDRRIVNVNHIEECDLKDGTFMLRGSVRRKRLRSTPPRTGSGEISSSLSERNSVKFVESGVNNNGRPSELNTLPRQPRISHDDVDVVVIDS